MEQQSYYMVIPAPVWNAEITAKAMILYGHVSVLAKKEGYCFANNKYFERVMKMSSSTVQRCFVELESAELIRRELIYKEGSKEVDTRKIYIFEHSAIIKRDNRPITTEDNRSVVSDDQDNSTRVNSTSINRTSNNNIKTKALKDLKSRNQEALFFGDEDDIKNPTIDQQKALQLAKELNFNIY